MEAHTKWTGSVDTPVGGGGIDIGLSFGGATSGATVTAESGLSGTADLDASGNRSKILDDDGFYVEQRTESKRHAESEEVREMDDHSTEIRHKNETEIRLDEVKVRESDPRPGTRDEIRALLLAELDALGTDTEIEVEVGRDVTVEEFTSVERQCTTVEQTTGEKKTDVIRSESHSMEESTSKPKWMQESPEKLLNVGARDVEESPVEMSVDDPVLASAPLSASFSAEADIPDPVVNISVPAAQATGDLYAFLTSPALISDDSNGAKVSGGVHLSTPEKTKSGGRLFGKLKGNEKSKQAAAKGDINLDVKASGNVLPDKEDDVSSNSSVDNKKSKLEGGAAIESVVKVTLDASVAGRAHKHHEVKHKKHVIEEVILEDTDTFYEELGRKRPRIAFGAKKTNKENAKPKAERRRSTGEIPSPPVTDLPAAKTISTSNVSAEQQVQFVVSYELPTGKTSKKSPKDRWSWTLPTFKGSSKGEASPDASENSSSKETKETKPKTIFGRQEEVVVEDTGLYTDSSIERKKWNFRLKKTQLPSAVAELPETDSQRTTTETVTFIVQQNPASSYIKVEPRMEDPEGANASGEGDEIKAGARGNVEFPKLKLFDRKRTKSTPSDDGDRTETVTYVVNSLNVQTSQTDSSGKGDAHGGIEFPKLKLPDLSLKRPVNNDDGVDQTETVTFVIKQPVQEPPSVDVHAKSGLHGGVEMPKIKLFNRKPDKDATVELDVETEKVREPRKDDIKVETVTFVIKQAAPGSDVTEGAARIQGGFKLPKLKSSEKKSKEPSVEDTGTDSGKSDKRWRPEFHFGSRSRDVDVGTTETVTFIIDNPDVSVNMTDTDDKNKAQVGGGIDFSKLKMPSIHFGGKSFSDKDASGVEDTETVTYEVNTPTRDVHLEAGDSSKSDNKLSGYGGFEFPKLKLKSKQSVAVAGSDDTAEQTETFTYIVQPPEVTIAGSGIAKGDVNVLGNEAANSDEVDHDENRRAGRKWLPNLHLGVQREANVDTGETVTYEVRQPEAEPLPVGVDGGKRQFGFELPKINVNLPKFKKSSGDDADADNGKETSISVGNEGKPEATTTTVMYIVDHTTGPEKESGTKKSVGISLPKVSLNPSGTSKEPKREKEAKQKGNGNKQKELTVNGDGTVVVEEPYKSSWAKGFHFGKKGSVSSSDSSEKVTAEKSSTGIKWKVPKFHMRSKASYDVTVAPAETNNAALTSDLAVQSHRSNLEGDHDIPDLSLDLSAETSVAPDVSVNANVVVDGDVSKNEVDGEEISAVVQSGFFSAAPTVSADIDAPRTSSHQVVLNGHAEQSRVNVSAVDRFEEFVFTGGSSDDRIRVTTTQPLQMTSTPKKTAGGDAGFSIDMRSQTSSSRQRPHSFYDDAGTVEGRRTDDVGSSKLSSSGSIGRLAPWLTPPFVIVAIDFGTTFSGYAFCFPGDVTAARERGEPLPAIHVMRKWEDGDPGAVDMKTPTTLLLTPDAEFKDFGFSARNFYHDLSPTEARRWLYFEKFKMALHNCADFNSETELQAANGQRVKASIVFTSALRYFRNHALQELSEQSQTSILNEDIRWVITVPAIWKETAKQFMRETAYEAGIASVDTPNQLLIALEPEAASIFVRRQRLHQLLPREEELALAAKRVPAPESIVVDHTLSSSRTDINSSQYSTLHTSFQYHRAVSPIVSPGSPEIDMAGTKYMIVDCGGGTVDITVYEMITESGKLRELHQATGGPYGSTGIDKDFEMLLVDIFGADFIEAFKLKRPAGWVDLLLAFESRKRAATPFKSKPLNVSLPFSFTDYHKKHRNCTVGEAVGRYKSNDVSWSQQGMLRLQPDAMQRLFQPTIECIKEQIANVLNEPTVRGLRFIFLVGGFAESPMLQLEIRNEFAGIAKILIPNDASLTILKGAVCYGLEPGIIASRKSRMTYGVAVVNKFQRGRDPESKLVVRDGVEWCLDKFDVLVRAGDSVGINDPVVRSYAPVINGQRRSIFTVYATESPDVRFVTDPGVRKCGTLKLELNETVPGQTSSTAESGDSSTLASPVALSSSQSAMPREIRAMMTFGDTEIKVMAVDVATGNSIRAQFDFMTSSG